MLTLFLRKGLAHLAARHLLLRYLFGWRSSCRPNLNQTRRVVVVKNKKILNSSLRSPLSMGFSIVHFIVSLFLFALSSEGSWGYYFLALPDAPVVLLLAVFGQVLSYKSTWILLIGLGTIWWYVLGLLFTRIWRKRSEKIANSTHDIQQNS
jgi:hypothetical protein